MEREEEPDIEESHPQAADLEIKRADLAARLSGDQSAKYIRVLLAALSGIPWVGGLFGAAGAYQTELQQEQISNLHRLWLREHEAKLRELADTLSEIFDRFENLGDEVQGRIQSAEYLALIRQGFRSWDQAETQEKRKLIKNLLANAGGVRLCSDDLVRLFIAWIDLYHESHFAVIREIYHHKGTTRGRIWRAIYGKIPSESSAEADLFKLLIRDLSTGGVIRQHRETNAYGEFVKRPSGSKRVPGSVLKSAFDDTEQYELTELGRQFVHYTMNEMVARIDSTSP